MCQISDPTSCPSPVRLRCWHRRSSAWRCCGGASDWQPPDPGRRELHFDTARLMFLRRTGRLSKGRKRLLLAGAALSLVAAGAGLYWHHRPPRSGLSYLEEAEREIKSGQLEEAVIALRNATRAIPDNPGIRLRVAEVYLELNRLAAAEAWARP